MKGKGPLRGTLAVLLLSAALGPPAAPAAGSFIAQAEGSPPSDQAVPRLLPPSGASPPATVRLRNPAYTVVFTPMFKVLGLPLPRPRGKDMTPLIRLLIEKGVMTEEWRAAAGAAP